MLNKAVTGIKQGSGEPEQLLENVRSCGKRMLKE